jgi:hypothetical protein
MTNYGQQAWLIGFLNTETFVLEKAMICSALRVAQLGNKHRQMVLVTGYGLSFEEGKADIEKRLTQNEWAWIMPVLR